MAVIDRFLAARKANLNGVFIVALAILLTSHQARSEVTKSEKRELKLKVIEMFNHAYSSYMHHAYPADELMPLSCKGRYRGSEPDRGDIDESLGNFSLTLIDTLDTLAVFGNVSEFDRAVQLVIRNVKFDADVVVSVFETNIRVLGGLLGAHVVTDVFRKQDIGLQWYNGELLDMAVDIADRLLVAFNTTTGIPYPKINLRYGVHHPLSRIVDESDTCTACAGTMIMEFGALSRLTGNPIYEKKAHNAMDAIWHYRSRNSDLVGTVINIHNGDWIRRDSGIGAGIDSYYEYCFKAYILLGDKSYLEKFNKHYAAINKYVKQGAMMLDVLMHQPERPIRAFVDALQAFWPGLQVLMGDLKPAIETHEMLYEVVKRHKFIPEAFTTNYDVYWAQHPLRPEFAESTYFLYEATKDPYYLEAGKHIVDTLELHARVPCGFAAIQDLRTFSHEDKMDSFVLAETFKYLYLLFSEESERVLDIHNFVFTTEAHLLPLSLSNVNFGDKDNKTEQNATRQIPTVTLTDDIQSTCPNNALNKFSLKEFARIIRKEYRRPQQVPKCGSDNSEQRFNDVYLNADPNRVPRLRAEHFQVGDTAHLQLLKDMGITVVQTADGKVQLMHQAGTAASPEDATDGIKFMQDMIQIAKTRTQDQGPTYKPRIVQIMSHPYNGGIHFAAGAAQFGLDISNHIGLIGELVESIPYDACGEVTNHAEFQNRIVIMQRGGCMFIDKVRRAQKYGALGVIIVDHNEGTSSDAQPVFAMSGDSHSEDVSIASVFLFHKEGDILRKFALQMKEEHGSYLSVRLAGKIKELGRDAELPVVPDSPTGQTDAAQPKDSEPIIGDINAELASGSIMNSAEPNENFDIKQCKHKPQSIAVDSETKREETQSQETKLKETKPTNDGKENEVKFEYSESKVGLNAEGKFVKYETTYTTYVDHSSGDTMTKIRVMTKSVPLESNSLEIDQSSLEKTKDSGSLEGLKEMDDVKVPDSSKTDKLKKTLDVAVEEDKTVHMSEHFEAKDNVIRKDATKERQTGRSENADASFNEVSAIGDEHGTIINVKHTYESNGSDDPKPTNDESLENNRSTEDINEVRKALSSSDKRGDGEVSEPSSAKGDKLQTDHSRNKRDISEHRSDKRLSEDIQHGDEKRYLLRTDDSNEKRDVPEQAEHSNDKSDKAESTEKINEKRDIPQSEHSSKKYGIEKKVESSGDKRDKTGKVEQNSDKRDNDGTPLKQPKDVICNSAGCFSSLEELNMFNGLAEQVRSNLRQMEAVETNNKEQLSQDNNNDKESELLNNNR